MAALAEGQPVLVSYAKDFESMDQDVKDLTIPKPEGKWCLVELPKDQLKDLEDGQEFYFKELSGASSEGDGFAALCTNTTTFAIEFLENTNTILIGQVSNESEKAAGSDEAASAPTCTIFAQCRGHLMTKPDTMDSNRVQELLVASAFGRASSASAKKYTFADLEYEVASSAKELSAALEAGPYVEHEGFWRYLSPMLEREVLDAAITIITAMGWNPEEIQGNELLSEVQKSISGGEASIPSLPVLRKAIRTIIADPPSPESTEEGSEKKDEGKAAKKATKKKDENVFSLDKKKMNHARMLQFLREPAQKVRDRYHLPPPEPKPSAAKRPRLAAGASSGSNLLQLDEFLAVYKEISESEDMTADDLMKAFELEAYVDEFEGTIQALEYSSLPRDPNTRLARLFELQSHWKPERLQALMAPTLKGVKVPVWLGRNAREVYVELTPGSDEETRMIVKKFNVGS